MRPIEYTSPWKKFVILHETTLRDCPYDGFGGSVWDSGNVVNTTYNFNGGGFGFWDGFKMGFGNFLGGMLGGILGGLFGGFNIGTCFWGGGGGFCGCNVNQYLDPNLAVSQTLQNWSNWNSGWNSGNCWGVNNWFTPGKKSNEASKADKAAGSDKPKTESKKENDKNIEDLQKEVEKFLADESNLTKAKLQEKYDALLKERNDENEEEINALLKTINDKAIEKGIELSTNVKDKTKCSSQSNQAGVKDDNAQTSVAQDNGNTAVNTGGSATSSATNSNGTTATEKTESKTAATLNQNVQALIDLGLDENVAAELDRIGVKKSNAGSNTVTLPTVLNKQNLEILREALNNKPIYIAAATNPNAKDKWIKGSINNIEENDGNLSFSIDCSSGNPSSGELGFKYKVSKENDNYYIDLFDDNCINQAKVLGYNHTKRQYKFTDGQLEYDDTAGTVVYKTNKK